MATVSPPEPEIEIAPLPEGDEPAPVAQDAEVWPRKHYEVVNGQIMEEPGLGAYDAGLMGMLDQFMGYHATKNRLGRVVPEMLFVLKAKPKLRRRPDVAFVSNERWPLRRPLTRDAAWDVIPDIAIEVTSPSDLIDDLMLKVEEYFEAGVRLVWIVYPAVRKVYVYDSPTSVRILRVGDELDGGAVLPGFRLTLASLFETAEDEPTPAA